MDRERAARRVVPIETEDKKKVSFIPTRLSIKGAGWRALINKIIFGILEFFSKANFIGIVFLPKNMR